MDCPIGCASGDAVVGRTQMGLARFHARPCRTCNCQARWASRGRDGTRADDRGCRLVGSRARASRPLYPPGGELIVRVLPSERLHNDAIGSPLPESRDEQPPVIRRAEVVAFALVGLLVICIVAVLYFAKAFFLPVVLAFVVGTMLSPAASFLERRGIPRAVGAVLIVAAVAAAMIFMIGLISSPLMDWSAHLPELAARLKDKLHVFDRPLALWQELQVMVGGPEALGSFQFPKLDSIVQPAVEFLSPTFTEGLLFFATLVLFVASWRDLRRALIMTFSDRDARLRTLRILNEIEIHLGNYLLTVTLINTGVGIATGIACAIAHMPNPAGLGALAATLNFIPIIGPVAMFAVLVGVGIIALPTLSAGLIAPLAFVAIAFMEGHFVTPTIIGRRLALNALAGFLALAFLALLWGPVGA